MAQDNTQNWHGHPDTRAKEMTVRHGTRFSDLCHWAVRTNQEDILEIAYYILGLNERTMGIPNLVHELSYPDSKSILSQWQSNDIIHALQSFVEAFLSDNTIKANHSRLSHAGSASQNKRIYENYKDRTFLLTLITHPLSHHKDPEALLDRRRLRIWLLIQAIRRLIDYGCAADSSISNAARYLVIDSNDEKWRVIDQLLSRTRRQLANVDMTHERFTNVIGNIAELLKLDFNDQGSRRFLTNVSDIAQGHLKPLLDNASPKLYSGYLRKALRPPTNKITFYAEDIPFEVVPEESMDDEEQSFSYLVEIDPSDSVAQQSLSSGSVFIQNAELSSYLPWSWERPLPSELNDIDNWVTTTLKSRNRVDRLGAAMTWLSMRFSRSLSMIERISLVSGNSDDWSISPDFEFMKKSAPRRNSGWHPNSMNVDRVAPFGEVMTVALPHVIQSALKMATIHLEPSPNSLGKLWQRTSSTKLETWFNVQARNHFERVTSSKLANRRSQYIFEATNDDRFTRLLTSHPNSALPGACSYATWDIALIEKGLELPVLEASKSTADINLIGSLLTPVESVLISEIKQANRRLEESRQKGLVKFHNTVTQYVATALYAATGARPLRDPFESPLHFSLEHSCVYVSDKNDDGLHNGRLIPLPTKALTLVKDYQSHLRQLAQAIATHRADLSAQILQLSERSRATLPFFFLLDEQLMWHPVGNADSLGATLFNWDLPANLFRHRYAHQLLNAGINVEVIEGWMGHAERGAATYSDYSVRCWQEDASFYQAKIDQVYESLSFVEKLCAEKLPTLVHISSEKTSYSEPQIFGQKARAKQRRQRLKTTLRNAKTDITIFLAGRSIKNLDKNELMRLSHQMLLRENRLPHPHAGIRFRTLSKMVERSESNEKRTFKKRIVSLREEHSNLKESVIEALDLMCHLNEWANKARATALKARLTKAKALFVGAALLAVEKRLSYKRLLLDVTAGRHFRVVQTERKYFFEYNEDLDPNDFGAPVQRHEISYKTASLLAHGLELTSNVTPPMPKDIREIAALNQLHSKAQKTIEYAKEVEFFSWLSSVIAQANLIQLPGMVGAALSERLPPTSAPLADMIRVLHRQTPAMPGMPFQAKEGGFANESLSRSRTPETSKPTLQDNAQRFSQEISQLLYTYAKTSAREVAKEIEKACAKARGTTSTGVLLVGYWMASIMKAGKGRKGRKLQPYAPNTLTTYWSSVSGPFCGFTYNIDLISLDTEEVTELCFRMLEYKKLSSNKTHYFGKRLKEFFRWSGRFGVAMPEWSELDIDSDGRQVSPGLITESEYLNCLATIQADTELSDDQYLMLGFVLILTYRFGLRANEAICLLRKDWCQNSDFTWVLVRNNRFREVKSKAGRRAVPLLFNLSSTEKDIVDRTLSRYDSLAGTDVSKPILCEVTKNHSVSLTHMANRLSEALIRVIRAVTQDPKLVLHHNRHSFYNRIAPALLGIDTPLTRSLSSNLNQAALRQTILGREDAITRRSGMALARLMGHRLPSTGLKNYCHLITEWADSWTPVTHSRTRKIQGILDLTKLPSTPKLSMPELRPSLEYPNPTLSQAFKTLRLVSLGQTYKRAGEQMRMHPSYLTALEQTIEQANTLQRFKSTEDKNVWIKGLDAPNALLESINDLGWQRLIFHANGRLQCTTGKNQEWPKIDRLPYLIGVNRHVLMDNKVHCSLARYVFDFFDIPKDRYQVVTKGDDPEIITMMDMAGFSVETKDQLTATTNKKYSKKSAQAQRRTCDAISKLDPETNRRYWGRECGGLIMRRSPDGIIRDSYQLAVAYLLLGTLLAVGSERKDLTDQQNCYSSSLNSSSIS